MRRDIADPYAYPGTDVLRNKEGFRNAQSLDLFEGVSVESRTTELEARPIPGRFDLAHLQAVHRHLFQDVYEWAGEIRTVNIQKGNTLFAHTPQIESFARTVAADLARENHLKGLDQARFVERFSHHFTEWNCVHPFREGNGRATRAFMGQLAREAGYEFDQRLPGVDRDRWYVASARATHGDLTMLKEVFSSAIRPSQQAAALPTAEAPSAVLHQFGQKHLASNLRHLAGDPRFADHDAAELQKAAYFRGVHEHKAFMEGQPSNLAKLDAVLANRAAVRQLPDVPMSAGAAREADVPSADIRRVRSRDDDLSL